MVYMVVKIDRYLSDDNYSFNTERMNSRFHRNSISEKEAETEQYALQRKVQFNRDRFAAFFEENIIL